MSEVEEEKESQVIETKPSPDTESVKDEEEEDIEDVNINDSMQLVDPEPSTTVTEEDIQVKPIETSDEKEEEKDEDRPPLPKRKSTNSEPKTAGTATTAAATVSPTTDSILTQLKDAFPNIEEKYIITVMIASEGQLDPAFNALLYLSDPESGKETDINQLIDPSVASRHHPRHQDVGGPQQLKQDELLARQLDEQFNYPHSTPNRQPRRTKKHTPVYKMDKQKNNEAMDPEEMELARERYEDRERRRRHHMSREEKRTIYGDPDEDSWSHFVEKDIPEVATAASSTLQETATKVSNWFNGVKNSWNNQGQNLENTNTYNDNVYGPNRNAEYEYDQDQIRQQEEAFRYYERQKRQQQQQQQYAEEKDLPSLPERRRFNSFGARVGEDEQAGEDTLKNHGISLKDDELSDDEDVPPQLPRRERERATQGKNEDEDEDEDDLLYSEEANLSTMTNENKIIPESTYIDTPDTTVEKKKKVNFKDNESPSKKTATSKIELEDNFLINTDDEEL